MGRGYGPWKRARLRCWALRWWSLQQFYTLKGRAPEGADLFEQAATRLGEQPLDEAHTLTLWRIRTFQSALLIETANFERARTLLEASLPVLRRLGTPAEIAFCLRTMGVLAYRTGDYPAVKQRCQAAIELYNQIGDVRGLAMNVNILGLVYCDLGEYAAARQMHEENLARRRRAPRSLRHGLHLEQPRGSCGTQPRI